VSRSEIRGREAAWLFPGRRVWQERRNLSPMLRYPTLDFGLGETADILRETVRTFAEREIAPRAAEIDRANEFPRDLWPKLGELG